MRCLSKLAPLADLAHEHGDSQPSARRLPRQEDLLSLWQMPPLAVVLGMGVGQKTGPQEHRMLAIPLAQRVHTLIQVREPRQPDHLAKQVELAVIGFGEPLLLDSGVFTD